MIKIESLKRLELMKIFNVKLPKNQFFDLREAEKTILSEANPLTEEEKVLKALESYKMMAAGHGVEISEETERDFIEGKGLEEGLF